MRKRLIMMGLCAVLSFSLVACGANKNENVSLSSESLKTSSAESVKEQNSEKEETKIVEVTEEATSEKSEDGTHVVTTESGEKIVISEETKKTENTDGSITYKTSDGKEVKVETDGTAEVHSTQEIKAPASSGSSTQQNTQGGQSASSGANQSSSETAECQHTNTYWQTVTEATCNTTGKKVKYCTTCGAEVKSESIAKTGNHISGDWQVTVQPTENSTGTKVKNCTVCGTQLESASIDKVAHSHNYTWGIAPGKDYKTNVCSCGDETGPKAYNLGNGVYGEWKDNEAAELMTYTNGQRANTWTNPLDIGGNYMGPTQSPALNNSLSDKAKQRALACVSDYSHNGMLTTDECLAQGYSDARSVSSAWMASGSHRDSMTFYGYTNGGTACLWYDSDGNGTMNYIWVLTLDGDAWMPGWE